MATPQDHEHLTALAFQVLGQVDNKDVKEGYLTFTRAIFKGICFSADAILRLHPESCYHVTWGRHVWNPTSMAALARVLMDGCITLHYFALEDVAPDEREFRFIIANLHCMREREDTAQLLEEGRPEEPPIPDDWSGVPVSDYPVLKARLERKAIPNQLAYWQEEMKKNGYFLSFPASEQAKWLNGTGLYFRDGKRYLGSQKDAGFAVLRRERARRLGIPDNRYNVLYRHLSSHSHIAPHAISQLRAFHPQDSYSLQSIDLSVQIATASVALAIRYMLELFPDCEIFINSELRQLLYIYPSMVFGLPLPVEDKEEKDGFKVEDQKHESENGQCQQSL